MKHSIKQKPIEQHKNCLLTFWRWAHFHAPFKCDRPDRSYWEDKRECQGQCVIIDQYAVVMYRKDLWTQAVFECPLDCSHTHTLTHTHSLTHTHTHTHTHLWGFINNWEAVTHITLLPHLICFPFLYSPPLLISLPPAPAAVDFVARLGRNIQLRFTYCLVNRLWCCCRYRQREYMLMKLICSGKTKHQHFLVYLLRCFKLVWFFSPVNGECGVLKCDVSTAVLPVLTAVFW